MGGGMSLLFAENGVDVSLNDPSEDTVNALLETAKKDGVEQRLSKHADYESLCKSLGEPKVIFFSLPHGTAGDTVSEGLQPFLEPGDIIVDCSNENWENTQRRQGKLVSQGVFYVGCGVSGGYQAARRGPSMCPGGEREPLDHLMPFFEMVAAKDAIGHPCVGRVGQGGAGHYVKMIHNGIEHGIMSALAESWSMMSLNMGMGFDEIGDVMAKWNSEGELRNTFLVAIGAQICKQKDPLETHHILSSVKDKVVQDIDGSEGTGIWSQIEAVRMHVPAPTLSTAHYLRLASGYRGQRVLVHSVFKDPFAPDVIPDADKPDILSDLRLAVYTATLASFVQGLHIIDRADRQNNWRIEFSTVVQIWRAGCIIQCDPIADLLSTIFRPEFGRERSRYLMYEPRIAEEFKRGFPALKRVVAKGVEVNAVIPSLSATLDFLKYSGNEELPTQFYEAEMDYFGKHMYDLKEEEAPDPVTGKHHFEWKPA
ncbi:MAG: hypothetical protein M1833_002212 [Piccolia ochrophora]|nr:MAG: hypothetical protein M1833_002212 [Piccolia ochrophora]